MSAQAVPPTPTNWEKLAATPQGATCLAIFERARKLQGESGPIAQDQQTARPGIGWASVTRGYWPANRSLPLALH